MVTQNHFVIPATVSWEIQISEGVTAQDCIHLGLSDARVSNLRQPTLLKGAKKKAEEGEDACRRACPRNGADGGDVEVLACRG